MSGFPLDSSAIFKHYERKSLIMPDREAETLKKWLLAHPGVEIISRDRGGAFAEVQIEGESCRFRNKYLPLFGSYCEKSSPLDHLT